MKKLLFIFAITLFTVNVNAQDNTIDTKLTQLLEAKNGMGGVNSVIKKLASAVPEKNVEAFTNEMNTIKSKFLKDTFVDLKKDYTLKDINDIYTEYMDESIVNYTDKTNNFHAKWRNLRSAFFRDAKATYKKYQ
jgi:hypothetical protein